MYNPLLLIALLCVPISTHSLSPRQSPASPLTGPYACPAAAWPQIQVNVGSLVGPQAVDVDLRTALAQIDPRRIEANIRRLVSFETRHTLSTQNSSTIGIGAAVNWVAKTMRGYADPSQGRMTVEVISYIQQPASRIPVATKINDVVATLKGSETPERYYVISGHVDSRVTDVLNPDGFQPGADDDASGTAISMELARVFARLKPRSTLVFAVVSGEEQGLYGSNFLAQTYKNASINVQAMFTNDIVGSSTGDDGAKDPYTLRIFAQGVPTFTESNATQATRLSIGGENDSPARELARFVVNVAQNKFTGVRNIPIIYRLDRYLRGGDHTSFLQAGYTACRFTEPNENFAHQHQDVRITGGIQYGDLPEFVDFDYVARVGRVNAATIWSLSEAPAAPTNVRVNTTVLSNDSVFYWNTDNDTATVGYEVLWRATDAPLWTNVISVPGGRVNTATVNLSKDNVVFGIRAVGKSGYRSPATFPFPVS